MFTRGHITPRTRSTTSIRIIVSTIRVAAKRYSGFRVSLICAESTHMRLRSDARSNASESLCVRNHVLLFWAATRSCKKMYWFTSKVIEEFFTAHGILFFSSRTGHPTRNEEMHNPPSAMQALCRCILSPQTCSVFVSVLHSSFIVCIIMTSIYPCMYLSLIYGQALKDCI